MKKQRILLSILALAAPLFLAAQQSVTVAERPARPQSKSELLDVQTGELANFQYLLLRLESAWEDRDLETVNIEKQLLLDAAKQEIKQAEAGKSPNPERIVQQKKILEALAAHQFTFEPGKSGQSAAKKALFRDFVKLMEQDLEELARQ